MSCPRGGGLRSMSEGDGPNPATDPVALQAALEEFQSVSYLRHNARRLEHLASLGLPMHDCTVLELGAGLGDHTTFFLDRGCSVTCVEPRAENCSLLASLMSERRSAGYDKVERCRILRADAASFERYIDETFDVVHCYGLLYHTEDPASVLAALARKCTGLLLLETCVAFGRHEAINFVPEKAEVPSQAVSGLGCRPTRPWLFKQLSALFPHVYVPSTQPAHEDFPLDWNAEPSQTREARAVFIASRKRLDNPLLLERLPDRQTAN
jgi:SAM-dependent methyltransferase